MGDEHLDTIPATESDEVIKSSVENLILIPSESEDVPEHMCDVPFHDNSPPLDTKSSSASLNSILEETNTFDNSLPEVETFCFDVEEISSGSTTTHSDTFLPEYEVFHDDHVKEISSGSPTTHFDSSFYASFIFDLSINPFPPTDRRMKIPFLIPAYAIIILSRAALSHQCGTFKKFNTHRSNLNESPMEIFSSICSLMDR
nr:hypothetical protein [Tanacetum cinerariifolium]